MRSFPRYAIGITLSAVLLIALAIFQHNPALARIEPLKIGAEFPAFSLNDSTGKTHTLDQYKDKIIVFNFCTQECPFSRGADSDINAMAKKYGEKGVVFLGVDSNKDISPEDIQTHIKDAEIPYPILKDVENKLADQVGARVTPEIYLVDTTGKLVYHGALDDRTGPSSTPNEHYLKDALDALLAGKPIEKSYVKAWGCGIKRTG